MTCRDANSTKIRSHVICTWSLDDQTRTRLFFPTPSSFFSTFLLMLGIDYIEYSKLHLDEILTYLPLLRSYSQSSNHWQICIVSCLSFVVLVFAVSAVESDKIFYGLFLSFANCPNMLSPNSQVWPEVFANPLVGLTFKRGTRLTSVPNTSEILVLSRQTAASKIFS
ncbi:hypothetical protein F5879DRAFT_712446 [Lentinula edodes]|nr:hypothetical protein F5879DRAFT_712446 [Lentinula edodes]